MKFGSLFAGIGGMDLGLERAGMTCAWQVEIDEFCLGRLNVHWPDVIKHKDVKDVGKHNLETVDLIAGGFPCQPHSFAGKRKGAEDNRNLWPDFSRIIAELKPRYVLAENVPGIVTTYIDTVLSDLESQAYTCATFNIPAVAFDAPHRRERIFIVAYSNRTRELQSQGIERTQRRRIGDSSADVSNPKRSSRTSGRQSIRTRSLYVQDEASSGWWTVEPSVGRVADGVPFRVERLKALGNAVVPQVAEWIGRRIIEFDLERER